MSRYKLFVGHLSPDTRERDLERFLKDKGFSRSIVEVVVKTGYGFVIFDDKQDADDAVYELNGKELLNYKLAVEYAKPSERRDDRGGGYGGGGYRRDSPPRGRGGGGSGAFSSRFGRPYNTEFRVLIENISTRCSWQDIKDYFRQAGEVTFAKCHRERMGEGVVEFASAKDMDNALRKLDGTELYGKRIKLRCENPDYRPASRSKSRSRSRSPRRRSRSPVGRGGGSPAARGRSPSRTPPRRRSFSRSPQGGRSRSRSRSPR